MSRIFITGSSDGLGLAAAQLLAEQGHRVTLHARNESRAAVIRKRLPSAEDVLIGDVATLAVMRQLAEQANATGRFDAVIHNVAIGPQERTRVETCDGIERMFAVNVLAPYVLTALMTPPARLVYLSSGMHQCGATDLSDPQAKRRRWRHWRSWRPWVGAEAYAASKFFDIVLAFAVAARWPGALSNALEPGWVATKMGGPNAPDDLASGCMTQAWLAVSDEPAATVTGNYFLHQKPWRVHPATQQPELQAGLLAYCQELTGIALPVPSSTRGLGLASPTSPGLDEASLR